MKSKLRKICSPEAYEKVKNFIIELHPNVPAKARPTPERYFCTQENHREYFSRWLENFINKWVVYHGGLAKKIETTGHLIKSKQGKSIYVKKRTNKIGEPDCQTTIQGRTVYFEVKIGSDYLSEEQSIFHEKAIKAGAVVFVTKTVDQFFEQYTNIKTNNHENN